MSDYISKSALVEQLYKSENQPTRDTDDFIEGYCEGWNDVVDIMKNQPTLSETEIIRKAFERVVERLEDLRAKPTETVYDTILVGSIIRILKEECGINE